MYHYDYIKKQIEKDRNNKFSSSFLAFLIENFTKRDFIFLNTMKFTSQGKKIHYSRKSSFSLQHCKGSGLYFKKYQWISVVFERVLTLEKVSHEWFEKVWRENLSDVKNSTTSRRVGGRGGIVKKNQDWWDGLNL